VTSFILPLSVSPIMFYGSNRLPRVRPFCRPPHSREGGWKKNKLALRSTTTSSSSSINFTGYSRWPGSLLGQQARKPTLDRALVSLYCLNAAVLNLVLQVLCSCTKFSTSSTFKYKYFQVLSELQVLSVLSVPVQSQCTTSLVFFSRLTSLRARTEPSL